jgi:hypothetical protein
MHYSFCIVHNRLQACGDNIDDDNVDDDKLVTLYVLSPTGLNYALLFLNCLHQASGL